MTPEDLIAFEEDIAAKQTAAAPKWAKRIAQRRARKEADPDYAARMRAYDKKYRDNQSPEKKKKRKEQMRGRYQRELLENPQKVRQDNKRNYERNKDKVRARHIVWVTKPSNRIRTIATQRFKYALKKGVEADREALLELAENPPSHCPILGIQIDYSMGRGRKDISASPSIDRIDPKFGYIRGNINVVSHRANTVKNFGTAEEHRLVAEYLEKVNADR